MTNNGGLCEKKYTGLRCVLAIVSHHITMISLCGLCRELTPTRYATAIDVMPSDFTVQAKDSGTWAVYTTAFVTHGYKQADHNYQCRMRVINQAH